MIKMKENTFVKIAYPFFNTNYCSMQTEIVILCGKGCFRRNLAKITITLAPAKNISYLPKHIL